MVVSVIMFFAFSPGHFTPDIIGDHDKLAHFVAFFALAFGLNFSFPKYSARRTFLILVLVAAGIEIVQYYFTSRQLSFIDFVAGMTGIFAYLSALKIITRMSIIFDEVSNTP